MNEDATKRGAQRRPRGFSSRREQREATRERILMAAVDVLVERGTASTTTLEVQARSGVGRGTLLHHFPTHADLLSATVEELVRRNEESVKRHCQASSAADDPLAHAIKALAAAASSPSYLAELELWAVARTDRRLHAQLLKQERAARIENDRVVAALFAPLADRPGSAIVARLTVELVRGMALSGVLGRDASHRESLLQGWIDTARSMLDRPRQENTP
ncbi:helix-turn-helix domain-containing protein [Citromicrobium bathyomarinum]|jgi:AcrR family transcriptional regulator|uniref:TetR/AcrR family transcriptional regulator n=1 Tax=unclassified Citromicrobium TaxID=2630544 RepID=UPI0009E67B97|nr:MULTISPECIES: TetR/AcrR family transcriptional regulator [unclassified Citromicrobium]MAO05829.1 TetR/AcrR family transcriptional regulator [Citromicrobium sp.]MAY77703.1 TetR/AcrR family transcriptional regulator [Citromicrobium sp.]|tara:strand:- start:2458 stop:3114 length:657 start_codon:yes stop_codon:yes gene_type:complete